MAATKQAPVLAWHWLTGDSRLRYGDRELVEAGKTYSAKGPLVLCSNGMHASEKVIDSLRYSPGPILCRVELSGAILRESDKLCARKRRVLWMADATSAIDEWMYWITEQVLERRKAKGLEVLDVEWAALKSIRRWLDKEIGASEARSAARAAYAARDAWDAWAAWAARAARDAWAAWAAYAARDAWAGGAAGAAWAAWDDEANAELEHRLLALAPVALDARATISDNAPVGRDDSP